MPQYCNIFLIVPAGGELSQSHTAAAVAAPGQRYALAMVLHQWTAGM